MKEDGSKILLPWTGVKSKFANELYQRHNILGDIIAYVVVTTPYIIASTLDGVVFRDCISIIEAKNNVDEWLIKKGCIFIQDERASRVTVLI